MKDNHRGAGHSQRRSSADVAAIQVICLVRVSFISDDFVGGRKLELLESYDQAVANRSDALVHVMPEDFSANI
jgi:hypothetical protein